MTQEPTHSNGISSVPHKILVMSGKGGVGKTTVSVNLAFSMALAGKKVGIIDVDFHGPNVPLMTGTEGTMAAGSEGTIHPVQSPKHENVNVMSISSFMGDPDKPIIWRGPMKIGAIRQFFNEGVWNDRDVVIIDCPPGTGDEPLSVAQELSGADGVIVVTSPQDVSLLDSRKSINFAKQLNLPVLGVVENLSGFVCPCCGEESLIFKKGGGEKAAHSMEVPFLGRIPITAAFVESGDSGNPLVVSAPDDSASQVFTRMASSILDSWK
ncbi:Mrp/NBP35 family ATP-binding protein [Myxococcota bacterium]|nr:Mrp/NBP35 family ATP-binding protein [Myxococcota bacterium]MBU1537862.1 Mrp/NBP35 family ATP-binding protein [Myxococcota bacterium]